MKDDKLRRLFDAARHEPRAKAGPDFEPRVMKALRAEPLASPSSLWEQLNHLFPRLAIASATVILLCVAGDVVLSHWSGADLAANATQISEEWLFPTKGF